MALALPPSALFTFESITLFVSAAAVAEVVVVVLAEVAVEFDAIEVIVVDVAVVVDWVDEDVNEDDSFWRFDVDTVVEFILEVQVSIRPAADAAAAIKWAALQWL